MWKLFAAVALLASIYVIETGAYEVVKNPKGYGGYDCPDGFTRGDIDYAHRDHYAFTTFATSDVPACALKGVKTAKKKVCRKTNGKRKWWMTFVFGYGTFEITKFDIFSDLTSSSMSTGSGGTYGGDGSDGDALGPSSFKIPQKFAIRAIFFRVRGVSRIIIKLFGDISQTVDIGSPPLDWRLKTFLCISFDTFPIYDKVVMEFFFNRRLKAKLWDLYVISCCEDMTAPTIYTIGKK